MPDKIYDIAVRYILRRPHSEYELLVKLRRKGFMADEIEEVFETLREEKHLNDKLLAEQLVNYHNEHKPYGRFGLYHRLRKKGFKKEHISRAIEKNLSPDREREILEGLAMAKKNNLERLIATSSDQLAQQKQREKLARFLISRGFNNSLVLEVLEKVSPM